MSMFRIFKRPHPKETLFEKLRRKLQEAVKKLLEKQ